jgi:three-Cys-motif partner protein
VSKSQEKYRWFVGQPPPPIDPHSLVKHELVEKYLESYIRVLLSNPNIERLVLSIIDGFAGGGEYTAHNRRDIHEGSPTLAIRTVNETEAILNVGRTKPRRVDAQYFFVEKDPSTVQYLKACLGARYTAERFDTDIHVIPGTFGGQVDAIVSRVKARRGGERSIFLLDQYAYDQVPLSVLRKIFGALQGAEVLLTFNVDSLITFLSDQQRSRKILEGIGLARYVDWNLLGDLKEGGPGWRGQIQRQLAQGIIEQSGAAYSTIFYVTPAGSATWTYWLVHLSNVFKARDVMMELHWSLANHFSHFLEPDVFTLGHRAGAGSKLRDQCDLEFSEQFRFDAFAAKRCKDGLQTKLVRSIYDSGAISFGNLLNSLGNSTPATASMIKDALDPSIRTRELDAEAANGMRREKGSTLKTTDILSRSRQRSLFFLLE